MYNFHNIFFQTIEQEGKVKCTLIPGDGVGPELVVSVQNVFKAANVPVEFEPYFLSEVNPTLSAPLEQVSNSIARNRVCLKVILYSIFKFIIFIYLFYINIYL